MTRINVGVHPSELPVKMLIAEHREIKRIPNCVRAGRYSLAGMPARFTLGAGHVKFFYNKLGYLRRRYEEIYRECALRGYKVQYFGGAFDGVPPELLGDYTPAPEDRVLLVQRLAEKGVQIPLALVSNID